MERETRLELATVCLEGRSSSQLSYSRFIEVVLPVRFERTAYALEGRCSIQLSYGSNNNKNGVSNGARTHDPLNHNQML